MSLEKLKYGKNTLAVGIGGCVLRVTALWGPVLKRRSFNLSLDITSNDEVIIYKRISTKLVFNILSFCCVDEKNWEVQSLSH